jgi:hypothetical protein
MKIIRSIILLLNTLNASKLTRNTPGMHDTHVGEALFEQIVQHFGVVSGRTDVSAIDPTLDGIIVVLSVPKSEEKKQSQSQSQREREREGEKETYLGARSAMCAATSSVVHIDSFCVMRCISRRSL